MAPERDTPLFSGWDLAALAGLLGLAGWYERLRPLLPDPVPVHFDALGRANGWAPKSELPWLLFGVPLLAWAVLLGVDAASRWVPREARGPGFSAKPLRGLLVLGLFLLMGACLAVPFQGPPAMFAGLGALAVCAGAGVALLLRDSLRALDEFRARPEDPRRQDVSGHYRLGLFYVNPEDPRLWVEKRMGFGWTLNFARPAAILVMLLLLAPLFIALGLAQGRR
jgi:uncharacterized membrane protein